MPATTGSELVVLLFRALSETEQELVLKHLAAPATDTATSPPTSRRRKMHRYPETALADALAACVTELGVIPFVEEFAAWRKSKLAQAVDAGTKLELPTESPYRRRYGRWEAALEHFGYDMIAYQARLDGSRRRSNAGLERFQFGRPR
jgi:hypothetical protein